MYKKYKRKRGNRVKVYASQVRVDLSHFGRIMTVEIAIGKREDWVGIIRNKMRE